MDEAIGTVFVFGIAGLLFGDETGRKIAVKLVVGSLIFAFIISPGFALALALAPFAVVVMGIGGLIAYVKKR